MADVDQQLLARTKQLDRMFEDAVARLKSNNDLRLFFTLSHGYITKKIAKHITLFSNPNSLMRLNNSFATVFLTAINGNPHGGWIAAFQRCRALETHAVNAKGWFDTIIMFPYAATAFEQCAGCMAKVHISQDLRKALSEVKDVDAGDYGNILTFVLEGHLYAEVRCRGRALGALQFTVSVPIMEWLKSNAKQWRNEAFEQAYGKKVPDPSPAFLASYKRAEGR